MVATLKPLKALSEQEQAVYFHSRQRRKSLAGIPEMFRSHRYSGASSIAVATINTTVDFPVRDGLITFKSAIRITADGSVATEHRGIVFELGDAAIGAALWVGDSTIGFHAGTAGLADGATTLFDNTVELPVGSEFELVAAVRPGTGQVRLYINGTDNGTTRVAATNGAFASDWAGTGDGSFATGTGPMVTDVPAVSRIAPDGFEVIEPLSVYVGQVPRHFV